MAAYQKVEETDGGAVTVQIWLFDGKPAAQIFGPVGARGQSFSFEVAGQNGSLSPQQALAMAGEMAGRSGVPVVVWDDEGLWQPEWGELRDAG